MTLNYMREMGKKEETVEMEEIGEMEDMEKKGEMGGIG